MSHEPQWTAVVDAFVAGKHHAPNGLGWGGMGTDGFRVLNYTVEAMRNNTTKGGPVLFELIDGTNEYFIPWAQRSLSLRHVPYVVFPRAIQERTGIRVLELIDRKRSPQVGTPNAVVRIRIGQQRKDRYMLTGADTNEMGWNARNYFACILPSTEVPTSVAHALEMLKPLPVKIAEANGVRVLRQGDIFAIRLGSRPEGRSLGSARILNTSHMPDEVIHGVDGNWYGRGWLRHVPVGGRRADHRPLHLGEQWNLLVRNTVPQTRR